jgi:excisionase family DNA binding protein
MKEDGQPPLRGLPNGPANNSSSGSRPQKLAGRRLVTLHEAADLLGLSTYSLRRIIWAGRLRVVKLTRRVQIDVRDLDRLIETSKTDRL